VTVDVRAVPRPGWDPLPGDGVVGVVGLEGEGFTSVAGEEAPLREGQQARWPKGAPHRLWTEGSTMRTLMIERFD